MPPKRVTVKAQSSTPARRVSLRGRILASQGASRTPSGRKDRTATPLPATQNGRKRAATSVEPRSATRPRVDIAIEAQEDLCEPEEDVHEMEEVDEESLNGDSEDLTLQVVSGAITDLGIEDRVIYETAKDAVRDETLFYCPFPDASRTIEICSSEWTNAQSNVADEHKIPLTPLALFLLQKRMSSTRSNAAHAITSTVSELYDFKDCTPPETRRKVAALLKADAFTCPDGFRSPPRYRFAAQQLFEAVFGKYWKGKRKVGYKSDWWVRNVNKQFIVLHFTAIHHALSAWSSGVHKQGGDFNRHNVLGIYNRLCAEWDALAEPVKKKLRDDLIASIQARLKAEGRSRVANERPFDDQRDLERDFLRWKPPIMLRLEEATDEEDVRRTPSPPMSPLRLISPPPAVFPRPSNHLAVIVEAHPAASTSLEPTETLTPSSEYPEATSATEEDGSNTSEDPFVPVPDRPRRSLPWKTPATEKVGASSINPAEDTQQSGVGVIV